MKKRLWIQVMIICVLMLITLFLLVGPLEGNNPKTVGGKEIVYAPAFNYEEEEAGLPMMRREDPIFFPPFPVKCLY